MLQKIFLNFSWPILVWMVLLFFFEFVKNYSIDKTFKKNKAVILSTAILLAIVYFSVEHTFRTLSDETNLLSSSASMLFRKTVENGLTNESYYGILQTTTSLVPKRPLLFSFLESLVHMTAGYNAFAGVAINMAALAIVLFVFGVLGLMFFDFWGALGLQLLVLSHPVMSLYATCAGFDLFSSVGVLGVLCLSAHFMEHKEDPKAFRLMLLGMTLLCHCRYESFAFPGVILFMLWRMKYVTLDMFKKQKKLLIAIFIFLLPILIQRILSVGGYEQPEGKALFSYENLVRNITAFVGYFWNMELYLPYNSILNILVVLAFIPALFVLVQRYKSVGRDISIIIFIVLFVDMCIIMPHVGGMLNDATQFRYFIIFCLFSIYLWFLICICFCFEPKLIFSIGFVCFLIFHPISIEDRVHQRLILNRELKVEMAFIRRSGSDNVLVISERPGMFTAMRQPAISFEIANLSGKRQQVERAVREHLYDHVYVFQHIFYNLEHPEKGDYIPWDNSLPKWNLTPLFKRQLSFDHYLLISEINQDDADLSKKKIVFSETEF